MLLRCFSLQELLHGHLKICKILYFTCPAIVVPAQLQVPVLESNTLVTGLEKGFGLKDWSYTSTSISLKKRTFLSNAGPDAYSCLDTEYRITLMDQGWLLCELYDFPVNKMATPFKVRGFGSSKHETDEYIEPSLYLLRWTPNKELVYVNIQRELPFVERVAANILIRSDIIGPEGIIISM